MPLLTTLCALAMGAQSDTVEVPFHIGETAIIVDAVANGRTVSLMYDTGFSGAVVLPDTMDIGKPTGAMMLRDFVGEFEAKTVKLTSFKLGSKSIDTKNMEAVLQPTAHYSMGYGTHTDGIMGFEMLRNYVTEINFQHNKFVFHPASYDITTRTPDNNKTFLCRLLPVGMGSMEMLVKTNTGQSMTLALDTGNSFYATTHRDVLERVGLWQSGKEPKFTKLSGVASGNVTSWSYLMKDATIFNVPVAKSVWDIIDAPSSSAEGDGTVGFGFLKNFNITVDYPRRRIWLERWTDNACNDGTGELGMSVFWDDNAKRARIYRVSPDSPADQAGVKAGDWLLTLDDKEVGNLTFKGMQELLNGPVDSKVTLAISHEGVLKRVDVMRKLLVNEGK